MINFTLNKTTLALLSSGLISLSTSSVAAQENSTVPTAKESEVEVISVTGLRRSLALSQAIKMSDSSIVEAISAEDIGKLPDASIAESISRLPGITAQRLDGRANVISIRGLSPDFTTATLNGREQVTVNDNRGVEFDQYPSELLSGVVVYKTPDASLISQAIGGTVDMQTVRPLAHGKQSISASLRFEKNDLGTLNAGSTDTGNRASIAYIDQFADGTIGIALGFAHMASPNQEERYNAWGYPENGDNLIIGGVKPYVRSSELERDGFMAVFEYAPNDNLHTTIDAYYSDFTDTQILRGIEVPLAWSGASLQSGYSVDNGLITSGQFNDVMVQMRNDVNLRKSNITSLGWNTEYLVNDNLTLTADLSYSKAERTDFGLESYSGTGRGNANGATDNIGFTMVEGGIQFAPGLDYADPNLFMIGGALDWGNGNTIASNAQDGFINAPEIEDELSALRLTAEYVIDSGMFSSIEVGLNYSEREKSKENNGYYLTLNNYPNMLTVPDAYQLAPTSLDFIGMGDMLSYDAWAFYQDGNYTETDEGLTASSRSTDSWTVAEDVLTAYVQVNLETELKELPLTGNFGLQVVKTKQSSHGKAANINNNGLVDISASYGEETYTELLPSVNVNLEVAEEQMLRLGVARTLARAKMNEMNASVSYNYDPAKAASSDLDNSPWSGSGGNPNLRPWLAWQYDLSYEVYFNDDGYISIAGYYKDLENYTFNESVPFDFTGVPVADPQPVLRQGLTSAPNNGEGGKVHGVEATLSLNGSIISPALEGFGLILNGGITASEVKETPDSDAIDLPGLSKKVFNATAYYEDSGFQARISSRYRSNFLGEVTGRSLSRTTVNVQAELVVDAQIGYDFSASSFAALDGLSVTFQVNNLTDEPFITYNNNDTRQVRDYQVYGRNFMLGMNYNF